MSCFIDLASAISATDDSLRYTYVIDTGTTIFQAFVLMNLQQKYSDLLQKDVNRAVGAGSVPSAGAAAKASYWNLMYKDDSTRQNTQCGAWESLIGGNQAEIDGVSSNRKANFGLAQGIPTTLAAISAILTGF